MIGIDMKMPKACSECPIAMSLSWGMGVFYCPAIRRKTYASCEKSRHPDCPLCELPDDGEIRIGDEVHNFDKHGVVIFFWKDGSFDVVTKSGEVETWGKDGIERTGRHFDEVETLLQKMRGE